MPIKDSSKTDLAQSVLNIAQWKIKFKQLFLVLISL